MKDHSLFVALTGRINTNNKKLNNKIRQYFFYHLFHLKKISIHQWSDFNYPFVQNELYKDEQFPSINGLILTFIRNILYLSV